MIRDGQPSPEQARKMARVFVIATLVGGFLVFLNVTIRSYNIRQQQEAIKSQEAAEQATTPATPEAVPQSATP
ncbi:hypothetical protein [Oligoflexus tunisiensis]|uniref:hypothetical protein n=1 Tax=Oligoflexus tunisiensis TaxID=708132 RepID=UPI00114CAAB7|nr:hypothetical protein [Oligoflexus tunisiensis]